MHQDIHQVEDCYEIRSLYFDDYYDRCMGENEAGVDDRKKYRIRTYCNDLKTIHLEIKEKHNEMTKKVFCDLTKKECAQIMNGSLPLTIGSRMPLNQLQIQMRCAQMKPSVIISYERTAFVCPVGNVRITFDRNIMASCCCNEFFNQRISEMVPVLPRGVHVLEVKYDEFLPDYIARQLEIGTLQHTTFSKYYLGRLAVQGEFPVDH